MVQNKITKVQKRDGQIVAFDQARIQDAIFKALTATGQGDGNRAKRLSDKVVKILNRRFKKEEIPHVEQIQDIVEEVLILEGLVETAKAYILYREQRRRIREAAAVVDESTEMIDRYIQELDWQVYENANMTFSLQGLNQYTVKEVSKKYWLNKIYPKEIREAAINEDFHIHNLETIACYCMGWDLYDLLLRGFGGVPSKIESRPAKHFRTALGQLVNFFFTLQGESAGAQAVSNFDTLLAPFIRYDRLNYLEVKQAMQEFLYNCMVPTRVGFQSLAWDEPVIIKHKGKIKFVEIGELIDKEFEQNSHRIIEQHPQSYALQNYDDYYTLSFDFRGRAIWAKVKAFVRHRVPKNSKFLKIRTNRGTTKVSPAHSLFSFSKFDGTFNPKPVSAQDVETTKNYRNLNPRNHFLALGSLMNFGEKEELDLIELIDEIPQLHKNVFVKINPTRTINQIKKNILKEYQGFLPFWRNFGFRDRGVWQQWLANQSIRYDVWRKFSDQFSLEAQFKLKNSDIWYPRILKGKDLENFVKLCAWYISEGHAGISLPFYLSQGKKKKSNYKEIINLLKEVNALGQIEKGKGFSVKGNKIDPVYKISAKGLLNEIISWSSGFYAFNKVIPPFIFELTPFYQKLFLETLLKGDALEYEKYWDYSTTSPKLSSSLSLLLAQNNYYFSVYSEEVSQKNKNWRDQNIIRIYKEKELANKNRNRRYKVEDFEARVCLKKQEFDYNNEFEYDISVDLPQENFVGGVGLLVFHNTPFINVTLDIKVPEFYKDQPVIIGGKPQKETYGEFREEMNMFIRAFYEGLMEGDAKGRPFTFPIPTVSITKDFNWDDPALDPLWEATAKYGVNYFSNFIQSDMKPEDFRSMCCRLRLSNKELYKRGGGLFGSSPLTGSIGVVTINMPRIGYLSKTKKDFFERLSHLMDLAKESLEIKRKALENFMEKGLYPYSKYYLAPVKKLRGSYFGNHFATIGLMGMNEALLNFLGENIASKRGRKFALEVLDFMRERLVKYQKETGNLYNLEATPGEGSLAPDEKVLVSQSDPKLTEIGPLVDKYIQENREKVQIIGSSEVLKLPPGELFTYGFSRNSLKIKKYPVTAVVRHEGKSMYIIKTASGRKVKVTGQHSVFTLSEEGKVREILVSDLKEGDYVAAPKKIEMENVHKEFNLIEVFRNSPLRDKLYCIFPADFVEKLVNNPAVKNWSILNYKDSWKDTKYSWRKHKVVPLKLIYDTNLKIDKKTLKFSKIFYRSTKNTKPINILIPIDEDFGFIIGSLLSEGWLSKRSEFTNTNKKFAQIFSLAAKRIFGKDAVCLSYKKRKAEKRKNLYIVTLSKIIGYFFQAIGILGRSDKKKIPSFVFFSSQDCVRGLLRGFHLGDGTIYKNKEKNDFSVELSTNSKELIEGLNLCLLRFGIFTKFYLDKKSEYNPLWKNNYILSITGADNLKRYFEVVFKKKIRLSNLHSGREIVSGVVAPIKAIMKKYSLKPSDIGIHKDSFNRNVRKNRISIQFLRKIIQKLSNLVKDKTLQKLKILANSDLYWDKVIEIKKITTPKYVYDLEVEVEGDLVNNFLGGEGLVCLHNTAYRQAKADKERYPDIITAGTKEVPYYTNSSHLPVNFTDDAFEALKLQDELQTKYTGGCVSKGNKVLTDKGLLNIEYIVENFEKLRPIRALSYNKEKGISEWDEIVEAVTVDVKKHNKIRIKGERNLDITTSDWHPFFVLERFKPNPACPICETKIGNIKAFATHLRWNPDCKEKYEVFPKYQVVEKRADELKIGDYILQNSYNLYPDKITELNNDLMWLVGFFIGDGGISEFRDNRGGNNLKRFKVRFDSKARKTLERVVKILNQYFGCKVKVRKNDKRSELLREVSTTKKAVSNFFFKYGFKTGKKVYNISIPREIKENLNKNNVFSLLSGLMDSDGALSENYGDFEYETVSSKLAEDILEICTLAGIMVSKKLKKVNRENEVDIWRLRIPAYQMTQIRERLNITVNPSRIKTTLSNRKKRHFPIVRVKKVSKIDVKDNQFYDLMTAKNHNYLAGKNCLVFIHNTVLHFFLGEKISDPQMAKNLVKKVFENFHLPYITLTPTFSICPSHGYLAGEHFECPKCTIKQPCEVYSRIVGYLRPVQQWNPGKKEEFRWRREYRTYQKEKIVDLPKEKIPAKK